MIVGVVEHIYLYTTPPPAHKIVGNLSIRGAWDPFTPFSPFLLSLLVPSPPPG